jgi:hypothetical protein
VWIGGPVREGGCPPDKLLVRIMDIKLCQPDERLVALRELVSPLDVLLLCHFASTASPKKPVHPGADIDHALLSRDIYITGDLGFLISTTRPGAKTEN